MGAASPDVNIEQLSRSSSKLRRQIGELRSDVEIVNAKLVNLERENCSLRRKVEKLRSTRYPSSFSGEPSRSTKSVKIVSDKISHSSEEAPRKKRRIDGDEPVGRKLRTPSPYGDNQNRSGECKNRPKDDKSVPDLTIESHDGERYAGQHYKHRKSHKTDDYKNRSGNSSGTGRIRDSRSKRSTASPQILNKHLDVAIEKRSPSKLCSLKLLNYEKRRGESDLFAHSESIPVLLSDEVQNESVDKLPPNKNDILPLERVVSVDAVLLHSSKIEKSNPSGFDDIRQYLLDNGEIGAEVVINNDIQLESVIMDDSDKKLCADNIEKKDSHNVNADDEIPNTLVVENCKVLTRETDVLIEDTYEEGEILEDEPIESNLTDCIPVKPDEINASLDVDNLCCNKKQLSPLNSISDSRGSKDNENKPTISKKPETTPTKINSNTINITVHRRRSKIIKR